MHVQPQHAKRPQWGTTCLAGCQLTLLCLDLCSAAQVNQCWPIQCSKAKCNIGQHFTLALAHTDTSALLLAAATALLPMSNAHAHQASCFTNIAEYLHLLQNATTCWVAALLALLWVAAPLIHPLLLLPLLNLLVPK